jgi:two-component system phosphate regulon response regulator OmpR
MPNVFSLLVVDDEIELVDILLEYFTGLGFHVRGAANAATARLLIAQQLPDLVILDLRMPGEDGLSLARWIREQHQALGIIMLTTAAEVVDRIVGLEMGADDYLPKPFELRELQARVNSVLRRSSQHSIAAVVVEKLSSQRVRFGQCQLDMQLHKLFNAQGDELPLTAMEFDLLKVFAESPNRVLNRDQLMELAHHRGWDVFDRSIDLRIMRLRRKIEIDPEKPEVIKTIRGAGYMYVAG